MSWGSKRAWFAICSLALWQAQESCTTGRVDTLNPTGDTIVDDQENGGTKTPPSEFDPTTSPDRPDDAPSAGDGDGDGEQPKDDESQEPDATPPKTSPAPDPNRPDSGPTTRLLGRFASQEANAFAFAYSASSFLTRVLGTGVDIQLAEASSATYNGNVVHNYYDVFVDGQWHKTFATQANVVIYTAAQNLTLGDHVVRVSKRTEPQLGSGIFSGFVPHPGGTLLPAPLPKVRKIEFIGDSITCGHGADGNVAAANGCPFSDATENVHATYGAQIADAVGAEFVAISYSGKGIIQNYDCVNDKVNTLPKLYPSIIPLRNPNVFDANQWQPQVVVINLGTNDYKMANGCPAPDSNAFTSGWTSFLGTIRTRYPSASIFCTVGPDLYPPYLAMAENNIQAAILQVTSSGDSNLFFISIPVNNGQVGWGCNAHPNRAMHKLIADKMLPLIRAQMHW